MNGCATKGVQNRVQVILQNVGALQQRFVCLQGEAVGQQIYRAGQDSITLGSLMEVEIVTTMGYRNKRERMTRMMMFTRSKVVMRR